MRLYLEGASDYLDLIILSDWYGPYLRVNTNIQRCILHCCSCCVRCGKLDRVLLCYSGCLCGNGYNRQQVLTLYFWRSSADRGALINFRRRLEGAEKCACNQGMAS
eukprot:jgi/Chrzof1/12178/Cz06g24040.t1